MPSAATREADYGRAIRGAVRALWKGVIDIDQFYEWMSLAIARGLTLAWYSGAEECGIQPRELSAAERGALALVIAEEMNHAGGFAASILNFSQERGGKLSLHLNRATMWSARWADVQGRAKIMACGDKKYMWQLGPTEHCVDCERLSGKVKRGSYWELSGVRPQSHRLACGGWRCACVWEETTARCSPGPLPTLVGPGG